MKSRKTREMTMKRAHEARERSRLINPGLDDGQTNDGEDTDKRIDQRARRRMHVQERNSQAQNLVLE